ncbi:MAG: NosD domain-containing protein, partial [Candidatus Kariarchaeaceae archaeon]
EDGIFIKNANFIEISANLMHRCIYGIESRGMQFSNVSNNIFLDNQIAIMMGEAWDNDDKSGNNIIIGNIILDTYSHGIQLEGGNSSKIATNFISNSRIGISTQYLANTLITENVIEHSDNYGLIINNRGNEILGFRSEDLGNSSIYANNFINNLERSQATESIDTNFNQTSDTVFYYNYWDDWLQPDDDDNGIVDIPYPIDGNSNNEDPYPVVTEYNYSYSSIDHEQVIANYGLSQIISQIQNEREWRDLEEIQFYEEQLEQKYDLDTDFDTTLFYWILGVYGVVLIIHNIRRRYKRKHKS